MRGDLDGIRSLYVHIPFCERKCEYCDFTSVAGRNFEREYLDALSAEIRELGVRLPGIRLDSVFFGGGTPSFIEPESLALILDEVRRAFTIAPRAEITMEANPSSTSRERAHVWRQAGFTRVSLGIQSLEPDILRFLGRVHDARRALAAIDEVRAAGFSSINCDLIYGVPGLGDDRWRRTLKRVISAAPDHVSCYELTVEPGTPLHVSVARGEVKPVDGARALRQHRAAIETLTASGYEQYEVSNFAVRAQRCRHNLVYWQCGYYMAAGVGAHGHLPLAAASALGIDAAGDAAAVRYWHGPGIRGYIAAIRGGVSPIEGYEAINAADQRNERIMLGLRLRDGVALDDAGGSPAITQLVDRGLLEVAAGQLRATARGEQLLNQVTLELISFRAA